MWQSYPIAKTSWALLQDLHHDPKILDEQPGHIAIACIALSLQTYGIQIPALHNGNDEYGWTKVWLSRHKQGAPVVGIPKETNINPLSAKGFLAFADKGKVVGHHDQDHGCLFGRRHLGNSSAGA